MALYCPIERVLHICMVGKNINADARSDCSGEDLPSPDHKALMLAITQNKDKEAFVQLFSYFAPRVKSYLMGNGCAVDQADELAQETMLAVWDRAYSYDPKKAAVSTWIFTIARNKRIDVLRKENRPAPHPDDPFFVENVDQPDELYDLEAEQEIVSEALSKLPEDQARIVYMNFFEDKSHAQIAEETHIPLGTIKSRIRLALNKLRGSLEDYETGREGDNGKA